MSRAPRIDTLRNRLTATVTLLGQALQGIEDLHVLAYDRQAAGDRLAIRGGERDYALDTHGDPRAREALVALSEASMKSCDLIAVAAHDVVVLLNEGDTVDAQRGRGQAIDVEDFAEELENQARRSARGEYTPDRVRPQPHAEAAGRVLARVRQERDDARREAERYHSLLLAAGLDPDGNDDRKRGWRTA